MLNLVIVTTIINPVKLETNMAELGSCAVCNEKIFGSQPICFGCFQELDVKHIQDEDGTEYTESSYEFDGGEEE